MFCFNILSAQNGVESDWLKKSDFKGGKTENAVAFAIGQTAYVCTGADSLTFRKEFWKYEAASDSWKKMADFPGEARTGAVTFTIGDKAYVGTGLAGSGTTQSDVHLARDGSGGVFVSWTTDYFYSESALLQHILASGAVAPGWPATGRPLSPGFSSAATSCFSATAARAGRMNSSGNRRRRRTSSTTWRARTKPT